MNQDITEDVKFHRLSCLNWRFGHALYVVRNFQTQKAEVTYILSVNGKNCHCSGQEKIHAFLESDAMPINDFVLHGSVLFRALTREGEVHFGVTNYLSQLTEIGAEPLRVCLTDKRKIHAYTPFGNLMIQSS